MEKSKFTESQIIMPLKDHELVKMMKTLLVKRIDSSFYVFKQSLFRFMNSTQAMVSMFENGCFFIAPNLPVSDIIKKGLNKSTIWFIKDSTSDTFILVKDNNEAEELTFLEPVKISIEACNHFGKSY